MMVIIFAGVKCLMRRALVVVVRFCFVVVCCCSLLSIGVNIVPKK